MNQSGSDFIKSYIDWLKSTLTFKQIEDYIEITTPFLDRHNDHLQIYVKQENDKFILTDDGYIMSDLIMSGCDVNSKKRNEILQVMVNGLGVQIKDDELFVEASKDNFPQKKHSLIQAMICVNDMFMLSRRKVTSVFLEDVEIFLQNNDIRYTPSIQINGKSGLSHIFDFVIPASRKQPERFIRTINNPSRDKVQSILFSWDDVCKVRKNKTSMYVFLNDFEQNIKDDIINAFTQYDVKPVLWTKKEKYIEELAS